MVLIRTRWYSLSRRGAILALHGLVFIVLGYSYLSIDDRVKPQIRHTLGLGFIPVEVYAWLWIACGALAMIGGLIHALDVLGFTVAVSMPTWWGIAYFIATARDGVPRGWASGVLWLAVALWLMILAGMADPLDAAMAQRKTRR